MGKRKYLVVAALLTVLWTSNIGVMQGAVEQPALAAYAPSSTALLNQNPVTLVTQEVRTVTGYSSAVDQTDNTPFITASGQHVRNGIIAANWLPFGTQVRFPEIFGDKVFVVEDRMAPQNKKKVDIWFPSTQEALQFGVHRTTVEIL